MLSSCETRSAKELLVEASKYEDRGNWQKAILLLSKAIQKDSSYLPAYLNRGADESALGHYQAAIDNYSTVIRLSPANTLALLNRGKNRNRLGDYRVALEDFRRAVDSKGGELVWIDLQPNNFVDAGYDCSMQEILLERGVAYYNLDSLNEALRDFQFCIAKHFALGIAYRFRGFIYIASGKKDRGCTDLKKAASMGDTDAVKGIVKYCN